MPYLLLALGALLGLYGLYRFFLSANIRQIHALFLTAALLTVCCALFYLAFTGKLAVALALLAALLPLVVPFFRKKKDPQE